MEFWTALTLGFVGSLHCAGMCGPLAIAVPVVGEGRRARVLSRLLYNAGRITTYAVLGLVAGLIGRSFVLAGFQRWVSMIAGVLIISGLLISLKWSADGLIGIGVVRLKRWFGRALQRRTHGANITLGLLNGLLPCGLVYVAATAAVGTGHGLNGALYMVAFGAGTLPMMLGLGLAIPRINGRGRWRHLVPASVALVGVLLILRGAALGIPLLSPAAPETGQHCALCVED
jgi:sulfite exporter TauE/SafE